MLVHWTNHYAGLFQYECTIRITINLNLQSVHDNSGKSTVRGYASEQ